MLKRISTLSFFRYLAVTAVLLLAQNAWASDNENQEKGSFDAGGMIIHHILDAHEIHFVTLHEGTPEEHHISIPLPIILYTEDRGIEMFSSSNFHNHEHKYDRYVMHHEKIYQVGEEGLIFDEEGHPTNQKPLDFSITKTVLGIFISLLLMIWLFGSMARNYKRNPNSAPKGIQSLLEPLVLFVRDEIAKPSIGKKYERYMPFLLTVFFFIWISNLLGLIPFIGGFNVTGNIAITLVLALITFIITTASGNKSYWVHILNTPGVPWWLKFPVPLMPMIEILSMFSKPLVLMLRLFANIVAGHIIILAFVSLIFIFGGLYGTVAGYGASIVSLVFAIFMNTIELLVAFLQAYVFTLLSALYFGMAVEEHHDH